MAEKELSFYVCSDHVHLRFSDEQEYEYIMTHQQWKEMVKAVNNEINKQVN